MTSQYQNLQRHAGCQFCNRNLTTSALGLLQTIWFLTPKSARRWLCVFVESWTISHQLWPQTLRPLSQPMPIKYWALQSKVISNGICTLMRLWLRHYQEALATTGCVPLHTRRMELCSKLFTKIKDPESRLRHLVPPTQSQVHGRSLRNKDRPSLISCKTELFKGSFFPAMCLNAHGM